MLRAVLLDLDETLIHERASTRAALAATLADACALQGCDPAAVGAQVLAAAGELWRAGPCLAHCRRLGISSWEGLWATFSRGDDAATVALRGWAPLYRREAWRRGTASAGLSEDTCAELAEGFVWERGRRQVRFAETLPALVALRARGLVLCLLTNGDADLQRRKAVGSGLLPLLDHVVISGEVGVGKPEPGIFAHALGLCGARPEEAVMVGDSLERDISGAAAAGVRAVWLDRFGEGGTPPGAWRVLPDLRGLAALLQSATAGS